LVEQFQLRAPTVMFIDDSPNNRAEVESVVPGIQVEDETFISRMLTDPRFKGKDDSSLSRLNQYKLLESRKRDAESFAQGNDEFLRQCDVRVYLDYDVEGQIDRAIELINRTNQLNYTKRRLPEDIEEARRALRAEMEPFSRQAGL
jgi:predicted enzyme involved in methoxymalonyl-ACP biosynthesis